MQRTHFSFLLFATLLIFIGSLFFFSPCYGMEEEDNQRPLPHMKFKLGFEFQEGSSLCPWALENNNVQKKKLFKFKDHDTQKKLWHVVIDTSDIEFVTRPFSYKEQGPLEKCIFTLLESFSILRGFLTQKEEATFEEWTNAIKERFNEELAFLPCFDLIHNQPIIRPSPDWEPVFSPQVTIQHPLEYSIPLYFGLFGFKDASTMMPFMASLPLRNVFVRLREEANSGDLRQLMEKYGSKIFGLTFLHAMTLVSITPNQDCDDGTYLEETHKSLTGYYQIDAKMKLKLMSRRPFSSMFRELDTKIDYAAFFGQAMCYNPHGCSNTGFAHFYNVPFLFHKANYAEQFFDSATGKIRTLSHLLPLFQDEFVAKNALILSQLLEKGVISTAMLRNLKEQHDPDNLLPTLNDSGNNFEKIPGEYFIKIINSIALPEERYIFDVDNACIRKIVSDYDKLSPPSFLNIEDSMGAFKDDMSEQDKKYGEAIIEVRNIKNVGHWFLKKTKLPSETEGNFLKNPDGTLIEQSIKLFNFLKEFGTWLDIDDITLGMVHAGFRY